jgi:hypothetical protein
VVALVAVTVLVMTEYSILMRTDRGSEAALRQAVNGAEPHRVSSPTHAFVECAVAANNDMDALARIHAAIDPLELPVHEIRVQVR